MKRAVQPPGCTALSSSTAPHPAARSGCPMHRTSLTVRCVGSTLPKANSSLAQRAGEAERTGWERPLPSPSLCCHPTGICFSSGKLNRSPPRETTPHTPLSSPCAGSDPEPHPSTTPAHARLTQPSPHPPALVPPPAPPHRPPASRRPSPAGPTSARASTDPAHRSAAADCCTATAVHAPQDSAHPEFASTDLNLPYSILWRKHPRVRPTLELALPSANAQTEHSPLNRRTSL